MSPASIARLLCLAAIWGGAFMIIRIAAPVVGPVPLIVARVGLAAIFLTVVARIGGRRLNVAAHWRHYLILGTLNGAVPFLLYGYAAQTLSASVMTILNATSPIWSTVIGAMVSRRPLERGTAVGLFLGVAGVAIVVGLDRVTLPSGAQGAIAACLLAAFSYGVAATYARTAKSVDSFSSAQGSMWAATAIAVPLIALAPPPGPPAVHVVLALLVLGIVCTGFAFLLFFRLVQDIGAGTALTVTFLIPVFGIAWGSIFLGERIGWNTIIGSALVIAGTALVAAGPLRRVRAQMR